MPIVIRLSTGLKMNLETSIANLLLVDRLRTRAAIRREITTRKSVQEGKPDRLADLLEEAADTISSLSKKLNENCNR